MKQLTFAEVCKQLKKEDNLKEVIDGVNVLSSAAIILLGARVAGGDMSVFVNALAVKDQLISIGATVLHKILIEKTTDCERRIKLIKWSYSVIYYTAYFDVLDENLPVEIRERINLSIKEKKEIFEDAEKTKGKESTSEEKEIMFPNLVYSYAEIEKKLLELYKEMSQGLKHFVHMLSFEAESDEAAISEFHSIVDELSELAIKRFKEQYLYLAGNFNEFYVYIQLESELRKEQKYDDAFNHIMNLLNKKETSVDVGLDSLEGIMLSIPEKINEEKIKNIVSGLIDTYKSQIDEPIIKDDDDELQYPSISEAFIPQSYKILEYTGKEKLEEKETWKDKIEYEDMTSLWAKYCISPDCTENLLLVLGEPGGGKSLLTKVLCARMIDENDVFVRIPLREVDVDREIDLIVREQLQKDGDAAEVIPTFKWFASYFKQNPITIIFDGYDEVLQATGGAYKTLLEKIASFQKDCAVHHRPIRIVVTSRETLIDMADIPKGTTVVKLLEFSDAQRGKWISLWNEKNSGIFKNVGIMAFQLPKGNKRIDELSRQPLLLLMLAIYDANLEERRNSLGEKDALNRTRLYDELLRRFIKRELKKGSKGKDVAFDELDEEEQLVAIDMEMEKLGVAALGMFNRGKLSLKKSELEKDLEYMEIEMPVYETKGRKLTGAELLFGSFFFVHDSQSTGLSEDEKEEAFEFLHKTFYEFLITDLILKYLVLAIVDLNSLRKGKSLNNYKKSLENKEHLDKKYYMTMIHNYLCAEAEILQMLAEWKDVIIDNYFDAKIDFDDTMNELFERQIQMFCHDVIIPDCWSEKIYNNAMSKTHLEYSSTYILNFMILQSLTNRNQMYMLRMDEWKYIAQFIRMNVDEEILLKFVSLFFVMEVDGKICLEKKPFYVESWQKNKLDTQLDIFDFLQDDVTYAIYKLHSNIPIGEKESYRELLLENKIDVEFESAIARLHHAIIKNKDIKICMFKNMKQVNDILFRKYVDEALFLEWIITINSCLENRRVGFPRRVIEDLVRNCVAKYADSQAIMLQLFKFLEKIGSSRYLYKGDIVYLDFETWISSKPEILIHYLRLVKDRILHADKERLFHSIIANFNQLFRESPACIMELVELFEGTEQGDMIYDKFKSKLGVLYDYDLKIAIRLMKYAIYKEDESVVFDFLESVEGLPKAIRKKENPELAVDLLELIVVLGVDSPHEEYMLEYIYKQIYEVLVKSPEQAIKFVYILSLMENRDLREQVLIDLLERIDVIYEYSPEQAVRLLKMCDFDMQNVTKAINFIMRRYRGLIVYSPNIAMEFLMILKECKVICYEIEKVFNYIFYNSISIDTTIACDLLDSLDRSTLDELENYFIRKFNLILYKYPALAKRILCIYGNSSTKAYFLESIENSGKRGLIKEGYLNELRECLG